MTARSRARKREQLARRRAQNAESAAASAVTSSQVPTEPDAATTVASEDAPAT